MNPATKALVQQCRQALLQQSDEYLAALLTHWLEAMIGEDDREEDLDDLCLLILAKDRRIRELEAEIRCLNKELDVALAKLYERV